MLPQFTGSSSSKLVDNISLTDNVNVTSTISKIAMLAEVHLVFLAWDFCLVVQGWMTFELPCCAWVLILADTWREMQGRTRLHRPSRCLRSYIVYPHSLHNPHSLHSLHNLHSLHGLQSLHNLLSLHSRHNLLTHRLSTCKGIDTWYKYCIQQTLSRISGRARTKRTIVWKSRNQRKKELWDKKKQ